MRREGHGTGDQGQPWQEPALWQTSPLEQAALGDSGVFSDTRP